MNFSLNNQIFIDLDHMLSASVSYFKEMNLKEVNAIPQNSLTITIKKLDDNFKVRNEQRIEESSFVCNEEFYLKDNNNHFVKLNLDNIFNIENSIYVQDGFDSAFLFQDIIVPIVRYKLLIHKEIVCIHSSSFTIANKVFVFPAWSGTGKTNLLLNALQRSEKFYADDLTLVSSTGRVFPYPKPLNLFDYNLNELKAVKQSLGYKYRTRVLIKDYSLKVLKFTTRVSRIETLSKVEKVIEGNMKSFVNIKVNHEKISGEKSLGEEANIEMIINIIKSDVNEPEFSEANAEFLAKRMYACHLYEWRGFREFVLMNDFLKGSNLSEKLALIDSKEREIMLRIFQMTTIKTLKVPLNGINGLTADKIFNSLKSGYSKGYN